MLDNKQKVLNLFLPFKNIIEPNPNACSGSLLIY